MSTKSHGLPAGLPPLSPDKLRRVLSHARCGCARSRQLAVEHNLGLVRRVVNRYRASGADLGDLFSAGAIGLLRAVELYRPEMGHTFATYATQAIHRSVVREMLDIQQTIRWPEHARCAAHAVPDGADGLPVVAASLDVPAPDGSDWADTLADPASMGVDELTRHEGEERRTAFVGAMLGLLTGHQRACMIIGYGLDEDGHAPGVPAAYCTAERFRDANEFAMKRWGKYLRRHEVIM